MKHYYLLLTLVILSFYTFGQSDKCLDFDGVNDYLFVGDVNNLGTNDFTIEAWINCESTAGIGQFVISKGLTSVGTPTNAGYGIRINDANMNDIEFIMRGATSYKVLSAVALSTNNWHHIAGVRSGIYAYLYLDGNLIASDSTSAVLNIDTNIPLSIGAHDKGNFSPTAEFMNGKIDEVRIWSTARSQTEINDNMDCAITSPEDHLIAVYNMNSGNGLIAADSSGYNNPGNFVSFPFWVNSPVAPICSVGLEELEDYQLTVFPNPARTSIDIVSPEQTFEYFEIIDLSGKIVKSGELNTNKISVESVQTGSYILKLTNHNKTAITRILVQ